MVAKGPTPNENDVIQAQINVSISQARNLVSSWFPAPNAQELEAQSKSEVTDDSEIFKPLPPRLGLGAPIPKDYLEEGSGSRRDLLNEQLRRRMLGNPKRPRDGALSHPPSKPPYKNGANTNGKRFHAKGVKHSAVESESEEEAGRSSLGKSKRRKLEERKRIKGEDEKEERPNEEEEVLGDATTAEAPATESLESISQPPQRRHGSFFDTHKAEKNGKKKKKKKNKAANID